MCVCVCAVNIWCDTHTHVWKPVVKKLIRFGWQEMGSRCETATVTFSNLLCLVFKVLHVSHYTRGSSTNTARTCGKDSLRALPPLKSPCSSVGRSSLYMFTEFYVRFIIIFFLRKQTWLWSSRYDTVWLSVQPQSFNISQQRWERRAESPVSVV